MIPEHLVPVLSDFMKHEQWDIVLNILEAEGGNTPDMETLALMALMQSYLGNHDKALDLIDKTLDEPWSFPVYWIMIELHRAMGMPQLALDLWQQIIDDGVDGFDADTDEDIKCAKTYINDCRYMISRTYYKLGKKHLAKAYKKAYLKHLEQGDCYTHFHPDTIWI